MRCLTGCLTVRPGLPTKDARLMLANRQIVWRLTQDLPHEAGWNERWKALKVPEGRQIYMRSHFGPQLGLI